MNLYNLPTCCDFTIFGDCILPTYVCTKYTNSLVFCSFAAVYPNSYVAGIVLGVLALVALCCSVCCLCMYSEEIKKAAKNSCKKPARRQTREPAQTSQSTGNNRSPSTVSPGGSNPGPTVADEPPGQKQEHPANPGAPPPYEGVEKVV